MTPQFTIEAFAALGGPDLVYVRPIKAREILGEPPVRQSHSVIPSTQARHRVRTRPGFLLWRL